MTQTTQPLTIRHAQGAFYQALKRTGDMVKATIEYHRVLKLIPKRRKFK